jgi:hypothetical protein
MIHPVGCHGHRVDIQCADDTKSRLSKTRRQTSTAAEKVNCGWPFQYAAPPSFAIGEYISRPQAPEASRVLKKGIDG